MRFAPSFDKILGSRHRPSIRLRTLMLLVVIVSLGLAAEVDRRRREEQRRLAIVAEGRRSIASIHESSARELRKQLDLRLGERQLSFSRMGPIELQRVILDLEKRIDWEESMAVISAWAADHPAERWPVRPPRPIPLRIGITHDPSSYPFTPVAPSPSPVPTIVKKNQ